MRAWRTWAFRIVVATIAATVLTRILRSMGASRSGDELVPPIGSDTWPPVPTNPDRRR